MTDFTRRQMLGAIALASAPLVAPEALAQGGQPVENGASKPPRFAFEAVVDRARELAGAAFEDAPGRLPEAFDKLDYDAWRDIRFKPDHALLSAPGGLFRL
ncbi:MAG TPA: glucan biosynthesis protein, partial [Methylocystis sp.]|nr:glucan biosynthesis protein [Methylocystis sp.]